MKSTIVMDEMVKNTERRFGSTNQYYPVKIENADGTEKNALFTLDQIEIAIERAELNPEDFPEGESFWSFLTKDKE